MGGAYALDFTAVMMMAQARGLPADEVADLLPAVEITLIDALRPDEDDE